jgi:adenylate cyclase
MGKRPASGWTADSSSPRSRRGRAVAGAVSAAALGLLCAVSRPFLELDETAGLDALFAVRGPRTPPDDVIVVSISKESAAGVGQSSDLDDWRRTVHADLVEALTAAGASLIAFDVIFDEPRHPPEDDERLAATILAAGNVVLLEGTGGDAAVVGSPGGTVQVVKEERRLPLPEFRQGAIASAPFTLPTVPQKVAQFWTFGRTGNDPSLPVVALQGLLLPAYDDLAASVREVRPEVAARLPRSGAEIVARRNLDAVMRELRYAFLEDRALAPALRKRARVDLPRARADALDALLDVYDGPDARYLNYYGPPRSIRTIPYDRAVHEAAELGVAGKVLFVGFSERRQPEQQDVFPSVYSQRSGANLSGVEIGATAFANMRERTSLRPLAMPRHLLLVLLWGAALGAAFAWLSTVRALAVALIAAAVYASIAYWAFAQHTLWLPLLVPLLVQLPVALVATAFFNHAELERQTERIQAVLGYYVPPSAVKTLAGRSTGASADRQLVHGICLFTDAEKYATASDALQPEALLALLNEYYGVMFPIVRRHGGYVSETAGDSMVAVWSSSEPDPGSRRSACLAAIEILGAVAEFNKDRGVRRLPTRIGIESGDLLLGHVGAGPRYEYRAIGDIITMASRLQALTKVLGTRVLISGAALAATGVRARDLGSFLPRGKATPLRVFEPLDASAVRGDRDRLGASFAAALRCFEEQRWSDAHLGFAAVAGEFPDDGPAAYYRALSQEHELRPPASWPGFVVDAGR